MRRGNIKLKHFIFKPIVLWWVLMFIISSCEIISNTDSADIPTFTVTFNTQGGTEVVEQTVKSGDKAKEPSQPTREGYVFEGWYKDAGFTKVFDFSQEVITTNITVYAKYVNQPGTSDTVAEMIKKAGKVDLFNIDAPLFDRKGNKLKEAGEKLAFSKIFPNKTQLVDLYNKETGYDKQFVFAMAIATGVSGLSYGFNVAIDGTPYILFGIDNKIYLDDNHYIELSFVRAETYMKEASGTIWEIPSTSRFYWNIESATAEANELNGYAGYKFTNFPLRTTELHNSMRIRFQVVITGYTTGQSYTLQFTLRQKLVGPAGKTDLDNYVIQKTFTTKGGSAGLRYKAFSPDIFFDPSNTEFAR